jgi:Uma2 family endonuclease
MNTATLITQEEYDHAVFEHDVEYVEGRLIERPMPTPPHAVMQSFLCYYLVPKAAPLGLVPMSELRIRTKPDRTRIPDVCLMRGLPPENEVREAPYLCIEILSPDDSVTELLTKIVEYLEMGVEYVWVVDPESITGEVYTARGIQRETTGVFKAGEIEVDLNAVPQRGVSRIATSDV